ncbi:glycosyltransferase family 2 protein [Vagococcus sp. BWB3-3]|uniref:Glycosyltransferase family 2 protein n=1 Tax=Vagococcus allomyrinae TaxID=2794353 RepID=A0A940SYR9_9ENTE|nr:glycosyltransferase family 2 protein [Vagococcus allomyrinae]MBP1043678.1 glycosyltransferase family 2 protein [Vagococcus allomyrinae]
MISVCMATYNGEAFIAKQLTSILDQLTNKDEVVIVDDKSNDNTVSIIKTLSKKYPTLTVVYQNQFNLGPIGSFQRAIELAKGDIIFLSDQDDQWLPNKVSTTMKVFDEESADLVVHDAVVIDGKGKVLAESWNAYNHNKLSTHILGNLIKNGYTGCMMAFKRTLAEAALPFPKELEMHDQWLALVAIKTKRTISIINQPLMNYVRHGGNVTGIKKRKFSAMLVGRYTMLKAIIKYDKRRR